MAAASVGTAGVSAPGESGAEHYARVTKAVCKGCRWRFPLRDLRRLVAPLPGRKGNPGYGSGNYCAECRGILAAGGIPSALAILEDR